MGLGYGQRKATLPQYPNLPQILRDAKVIRSRLYSIYLNHFKTPALAVNLDTGSTSWAVPMKVYELIRTHFTYIDNTGLCACSHRYNGDTLTLTFASRLRITVPAQQFLVPIYNKKIREPITYKQSGDPACSFMISVDDKNSPYLPLGASILANMYVVFDLDNGQLSMAQAAINSTEASAVVTVAAGPNGVASAVSSVLSADKQTWSIAPQMSATQTYIARIASSPVGTATGTDAVRTEARPVPASATTSSAAMSHAFELPRRALSVILTTSWMFFMVACGTVLGS